MNESLLIDLTRDAVMTIITVSAPIMLVALIVGLIVSIFQTVTSIQEQTLTFVPKILAVFVSLLILGPWILNQLVELIRNIYTSFSTFIVS